MFLRYTHLESVGYSSASNEMYKVWQGWHSGTVFCNRAHACSQL